MIDGNAILRDKLQQLIVMEKLEAPNTFYFEFGLNLKEELEQTYFSEQELKEINELADKEIKQIMQDE